MYSYSICICTSISVYSALCELQVRARRAQGGPRRRTGGGARAEAPDAGHARRRRARRGQLAPEAHAETCEEDERLGARQLVSGGEPPTRATRHTLGLDCCSDWTDRRKRLLLKLFCFDGLLAHLPLAVLCAYMDLSPVSCRLPLFTLILLHSFGF